MGRKYLLLLGVAMLTAFGARAAWRECVLQQLASSGGASAHEAGPFDGPEGKAALDKRNGRFADLWMARQRRDVVPEIASFLDDPYYGMRKRAVRALGWLEKPSAKPYLEKTLQRVKSGKEPQVPVQLVHWALGRIDARHLRGKAKLQAVTQSAGFSWDEMVRLSRKVYAPPTLDDVYAVQGSVGMQLLQEVAALLYAMGKQGDNIQPFVAQLTLPRAYHVYLRGAQQNVQQEIELVLNYSTREVEIVGPEEEWVCEDHLVALGQPALDAIERRLRDMLAHPTMYPEPSGYGTRHIMIFRAAAKTRRRDFLGLLRKFEEGSPGSQNKWVGDHAYRSRIALEERSVAPRFPA